MSAPNWSGSGVRTGCYSREREILKKAAAWFAKETL
jgi:hypothetical protein